MLEDSREQALPPKMEELKKLVSAQRVELTGLSTKVKSVRLPLA
jgi:hypothetical protein